MTFITIIDARLEKNAKNDNSVLVNIAKKIH